LAKKLILPRENLFRAVYSLPTGGEAQRAVTTTEGDGDGRTLALQWFVANRWTEIDSWFEGRFMEQIAPGAAAKTIRENRANMRILLQHGRDPQLGDKPIAPIDTVEENDLGGYAEGRLFDGLDPLVVEGLRAGVYGASFRFRVMREEIVEEPGESEHNPHGLPERTIKEMAVQEFGPVTWGAYSEASAGVRSITDEMYFGAMRGMPAERLREVAAFWRTLDDKLSPESNLDAPSEEAAESGEAERREQDTQVPDAPPTKGTRKVKDYLHSAPRVPEWFLP